MTIKNILCPVDLSDISRRALAYAAALSRSHDARLRVLEVVDASMPSMPPGPWQGCGLTDEVRQACLDELNQFIEPCRTAGVSVEIHVTEGNPAVEIVADADAIPADLLVMGTHGRGGFERVVLGSVTEKALQRARCPVLAVPPGDHHVPHREPFGVVVCALDCSRPSKGAVEYARALTLTAGGTLILFHAVEWPFGDGRRGQLPPEIEELRRTLQSEAARHLHEAAPPDTPAGLTVQEIVAVGSPYREILQCARERSADLIVMGVHGRGVVDVALMGSTTHHVLRESACPVLTVRT
jgi:nucleotide-binding universal stress UspA family protein